jgi:hypothetical protein
LWPWRRAPGRAAWVSVPLRARVRSVGRGSIVGGYVEQVLVLIVLLSGRSVVDVSVDCGGLMYCRSAISVDQESLLYCFPLVVASAEVVVCSPRFLVREGGCEWDRCRLLPRVCGCYRSLVTVTVHRWV